MTDAAKIPEPTDSSLVKAIECAEVRRRAGVYPHVVMTERLAKAVLDEWREERRAVPAQDVELWRHNSVETWQAMCAMRDAINERIPMPSLESDLLKGPESSVFCAAVAEAVIQWADLARAEHARLREALSPLAFHPAHNGTAMGRRAREALAEKGGA